MANLAALTRDSSFMSHDNNAVCALDKPASLPGAEGRQRKKRASDDPAGLVPPVAIAQQALVELACRKARQLLLKVEGARTFLRREIGPAERIELGSQRRVGRIVGHRLDNRFHLFAKILVGNTEDSGVGDLRMRDEEVLAFLRID